MLGNIIGAGLNFLGNVIGGNIAAKSNERAADKQYEYQKDLINRQNVYNSPANQMKRLQEAGLNPNLVYGGGNVVGNQSGTGTAPSVASNGDYGLSAGVRDAINSTMAIDNHDMDMQMKQQEILQKGDTHNAVMKQAKVQLEKTQTEDKVLKAQLEALELDNIVRMYIGSNVNTSKDNFLYKLLGGFAAGSTGNSGNIYKILEFKKRFGYTPSKPELINYIKGSVL